MDVYNKHLDAMPPKIVIQADGRNGRRERKREKTFLERLLQVGATLGI